MSGVVFQYQLLDVYVTIISLSCCNFLKKKGTAISSSSNHRHIKYSLDFLRPIRTAEACEAVDWLADLPQRTWPQANRPVERCHFDVILLKSTAAILAVAMFVGDRTMASTLLAGAADVVPNSEVPCCFPYHEFGLCVMLEC